MSNGSNQCSETKLDHSDLETASSQDIVKTLQYLVGLGGTCVLNRENLTLSDLVNFNFGSVGNSQSLLNASYFGNTDSCRLVFNQNADIDFEYWKLKNVSRRSGKRSALPLRKKLYPDCVCLKDNSGYSCNSNFEMPQSLRLTTHETVLNISGSNETDYYLYTTEMYRLKRYGGLSFDNERVSRRPDSCQQAKQDTVYFADDVFKRYKLVQNLIKNKKARVWYNNKVQ